MAVAILLVLAGCKGDGAGNKRVPQAADSLYTAAYAMTFVDTEPERALLLIDSARLAGSLSDVRADIQLIEGLWTPRMRKSVPTRPS